VKFNIRKEVSRIKMKTINKALDILEIFLTQKGEMTLKELARVTSLNAATAHRIVTTLVKRGYLIQKSKRGKYCVGAKSLGLCNGELEIGAIRNTALPFLKELNKATEEAVNLAVLGTNAVITIGHVMTNQNYRLQMLTPPGTKNPLHCTGLGKALLSGMSESEVKKLFKGKGLERHTKYTITSVDGLCKELQKIRKSGISEDREEVELGARCVAAPVKDYTGKTVAAISVAAPAVRLSDENLERTKKLVKSCALNISKAFGYKGDRDGAN
jgi:DNA-binding IclR family transcriptional regulator